MSKLLILCAAFALAACSQAATVAFINAAQVKAQQGCNFIPTAQTIADIFAKGDPTVTSIEGMAKTLCDVVAPVKANAPLGLLATHPAEVSGVPVQGTFVK